MRDLFLGGSGKEEWNFTYYVIGRSRLSLGLRWFLVQVCYGLIWLNQKVIGMRGEGFIFGRKEERGVEFHVLRNREK